MSVDFELRISRFRVRSLEGGLRAWAAAQGLAFEACVTLSEDGSRAVILVPGCSIRGLGVDATGALTALTFELRLQTCASRGDWELAYSLMSWLLERRAEGSDESGGSLALAGLTPRAAAERWRAEFAGGLRALEQLLREGGECVRLPCPGFSVAVVAADLPALPCGDADLERVQAVLIERVARYAAARPASIIELSSGSRVLVWSLAPTHAPEVELVAIPDLDDPAPTRWLPWADLIEAAPDVVETIPGTPVAHYLRALDPARPEDARIWTAIFARSQSLEEL